MPALPRDMPRYTRDVRQEWERLGKPVLPARPDNAHHALEDAKWVREILLALEAL